MLKRLDYWASSLEELPNVREVILEKKNKRYKVTIKHGTHNFMGTSGTFTKVLNYMQNVYKELK